MEDDEKKQPVSTAEMPDDPEHRVAPDDFRYHKDVDDDHDRGCQEDDQTDKNLRRRARTDLKERCGVKR